MQESPCFTESLGQSMTNSEQMLDGLHVCVLTSAHPIDDVRVKSKLVDGFLEEGARLSWVGPGQTTFGGTPNLDPRIEYTLARANRQRRDRLTASRRVAALGRSVTDVDWFYTPDVDAAAAAVRLARGSNARVLFDIHEMFHGAMLKRWTFGRDVGVAQKLMKRRVRIIASSCDLIIGVNEAVLNAYTDSTQDRLVVRSCAPIWFGAGNTQESQTGTVSPARNDSMHFMHGKVALGNGTEAVLRAIQILDRLGIQGVKVDMFTPPSTSRVAADPVIRALEGAGTHQYLNMRSPVPHSHMPAVLRDCEVGMIAYGRGLGEDSLPNRLFEYMACGLAILAPSYSTHIRRIVDEEGIGMTVDFESPDEIAEAIQWFRGHRDDTAEMGRRARSAFVRAHNWSTEFGRLAARMT